MCASLENDRTAYNTNGAKQLNSGRGEFISVFCRFFVCFFFLISIVEAQSFSVIRGYDAIQQKQTTKRRAVIGVWGVSEAEH